MLDWLTQIFTPNPKRKWVVELDSPGFVTDATMKKGANSDDLSHTIKVEFKEPVRENNEISHLNLRYDGQVIDQINLFSGDATHSFGCNPYSGSIEMVTVDSDDKVVSTEKLTMEEMRLTEIYEE